ncbi:Fc.00g041070.m01.CDS01 [Cosmosporella sp. VM-42]
MATAFGMAEKISSPSSQIAGLQQETSPASPWIRPLKQFGLFAAGAGFLAASIAISRRSVLRRRLHTIPSFYTSNRAGPKFDSSDRSLMAVEALGLATLNVMSFGIALVGGVAWGFDLSSTSELRERSQAAIRRKGFTNVSPEDEEEMKNMMSDLLGRLGMDKPEGPETPGTDQESKKD